VHGSQDLPVRRWEEALRVQVLQTPRFETCSAHSFALSCLLGHEEGVIFPVVITATRLTRVLLAQVMHVQLLWEIYFMSSPPMNKIQYRLNWCSERQVLKTPRFETQS
jgi:hypothetical protein